MCVNEKEAKWSEDLKKLDYQCFTSHQVEIFEDMSGGIRRGDRKFPSKVACLNYYS